MKLYEFMRNEWGYAFKNISAAFHKYAPPHIIWVNTPEEADICIFHVVGGGEIEELKNFVDKSVIVQHCYFTACPDECNYTYYWNKALLTISFHNLKEYTSIPFKFFRTPWGAEESIYKYNTNISKKYKVFTTGHVAESEAIDKIFDACSKSNSLMLHTGENFKWKNPPYIYSHYMNDSDFLKALYQSEYVAGLRLIEGFEIMCIEGLFTGARPIVPKLPSYELYGEFADYIDTSKDISSQLINLFTNPTRKVSIEERNEAVNIFSWNKIIKDIYENFL